MESLIQRLFRKLVNETILGEFWRSVVRHYGEDVVKLDDDRMRYIIRARERGERASEIAIHLRIKEEG